jgi:AraC family transcriptional regulator
MGNSDSTPTSYLDALRCIDMARLRALSDQAPGDPMRAVDSMVTVRSADADFDGLLVWEQTALAQEYYIPPNHSYDVFIRVAAASPVVQWREGVLDVRHDATGQIVVVPPYRAAYFRTFGRGQNIHLSIAPGMLMRAAGRDRPDPTVRLRTCFGDRDEVVSALGRALLSYVKAPGERPKAFMDAASSALAVRLLERFAERGTESRRVLSSHQIKRINDYLMAQLDRPVSLQEMAQLAGLSPQVFHRAFKAATGLPPVRYSLQLRMRHARDLVEGTAKPIGEIGATVGFEDLAHFSNTFRKHWGVSPTRLRLR